MERWKWLLLGAFILVVVIIIIVVLVMVFDRGPSGPSGPSGMTGQTGTSPCGNATVFDQLCLLNGTVVTFTSQQTGGMMGICNGDVLNPPDNWCVEIDPLNFVSTSPNLPDSTSWEVLRSTNNQAIAFKNLTTGDYLSYVRRWQNCSPCTFGFGCNFPVTTWNSSVDPNNPQADAGSWFTINLLDLGTFTIQIVPLNTQFGILGSDSNQMNSNSCLDMVTAHYTLGEAATRWTLDYVG